MSVRFGRFVLLGLVLALAATPAAAVTRPVPPAAGSVERGAEGGVAPLAGQLRAADAVRAALPGVRVDWNTRFGTPWSIIRHGASLGGPRPGVRPEKVARDWLGGHAALFGWTRADVGRLSLEKVLRQPGGGPVAVLFHQTFAGLHGGAHGGSIVASLDRQGRVLTVRANVVRAPRIAEGRRIDAAAAMAVAAGVARAPKTLGSVHGWTRFEPGGFGGPHFVRPAAFPLGGDVVRPAFDVMFVERTDSAWHVVVDAIDGRVHKRSQLVDHAAPEGRVFRNYPGARRGGAHEMVSFRGHRDASPAGWLNVKTDDVEIPTTLGNNAYTATHWVSIVNPDGPGQMRPLAPTGTFDEEFTNAWETSKCGDVQPAGTVAPTFMLDAMPATVNLFYHHNVAHDYWWTLGFDEAAGAMQANNFGKAGLDGDPLWGLVQNGSAAARNNAYMLTLPDGLPSWSGMFVFEPTTNLPNIPCRDGDFDAGIIYHEYAHGVTSRWVGSEWGNLETPQGGAMGESWGDFYGIHYLFQQGVEQDDVVGPYATGDTVVGIRNWSMSGVEAHYGDFGYDGGPGVHSDGEIWNGTLWDLRESLAARRGAGTSYAAQIIADAMPIAGPSPSMLDMRDAILASDLARTGGAFQPVLWAVFARHGMGASAKTPSVGGALPSENTSPVAAFDVVDAKKNGRIKLRLADPVSGRPLWGAEVIAGTVEASRPLATAGKDGTVSLLMAEGDHTLTVRLGGYGSRSITTAVSAGKVRVHTIELEPNYASKTTGAKIVASSQNATALVSAIDDLRGSAASVPAGSSVTIELAGTAPVLVDHVRVAAGRGNGALGDFEVQTSTDGRTFRKYVAARLGYDSPWSFSMHSLRYRSYRAKRAVAATHVRVIARTPQVFTATSVAIGEVQVFGTGDRYASQIAAPISYEDEGRLTVPVPVFTGTSAGGVQPGGPTEMAMAANCAVPPTNGVDTWVSTLAEPFRGGGARIRVEAPTHQVPNTLPEFDVVFLNAQCKRVGFMAAPDPQPFEVGIVPPGTMYILTQLFAGGPTDIVVNATMAAQKMIRIGAAPRRR